MINRLAEYSDNSKPEKDEVRTYERDKVEVVSQCKYLDIVLTPNLSLYKHFEQKIPMVMYSINRT